MRERDWSAPTDGETVARRAAGRRHYNSVRQFAQHCVAESSLRCW